METIKEYTTFEDVKNAVDTEQNQIVIQGQIAVTMLASVVPLVKTLKQSPMVVAALRGADECSANQILMKLAKKTNESTAKSRTFYSSPIFIANVVNELGGDMIASLITDYDLDYTGDFRKNDLRFIWSRIED